MADWPKDLDACINCTGDACSYAYGARGLCRRCYYITKYVQDVRAWDRKRHSTLKRISKDGMCDPADRHRANRLVTDGLPDDEFARYQKRILRQLKDRLNLLRHREEIRRCAVPISPLSLERKFAEMLHLIKPKAKYPGNANYLNKHFSEQERRIIYALLEGIIEQVPWHGIEWSSVYLGLRNS